MKKEIKNEYIKALERRPNDLYSDKSSFAKEEILMAALLPLIEAFEIEEIIIDGIEYDATLLKEDVEAEGEYSF